MLIENDPDDCPKTVTFPGSPPNGAIFRSTHCNAASGSSKLIVSGSPVLGFAGQNRVGQKSQRAQAVVERDGGDIAPRQDVARIWLR